MTNTFDGIPTSATAPAYLPGGAGHLATPSPPPVDPPPWYAWWNIKPAVYSVLPDGSFLIIPQAQFGLSGDDATYINYALGQGAPVRLAGPFTYNIASTLNFSSFDTMFLNGATLQLAPGLSSLFNMITNPGNANAVSIRGPGILDGNKTNNAGTWQSGIVLNNLSVGPFYTDGRHQVSNLIIQNFTGDGFVQVGRGSSQFRDLQVWQCDGFGMNVHEDCYYSGCDVGASGIDGVIEQGASNNWSSCKFWFSGAKLVSGRGAGATLLSVAAPGNSWDGGGIAGLTFSTANGYGNGFNVQNITGASVANSGSGGSLAACYFQDNARAGYCNINGSQRRVLAGVVADSNSNCGTTGGGAPNGTFAGFDIASSNLTLEGSSFDRASNVNHQAGALNITTGANSNKVRLTFTGTLNDGSNMPPLIAGSVVTKSDVSFKGQGYSYFNPGFAATYTPDPYAAEIHEMTLTANITVANPALAGTNTTGLFLLPGMKLTIVLIEDGIGAHTVAFGGAYLGASAANTAASRTNVWQFVFDGTNWLETSFQNF